MSYYILPKNINIINVNPVSSNDECIPYISFSLLKYHSQINKQIREMFSKDSDLLDNSFEEAIKIINPYEFIFSKVPGSKFSVSKLKPKTNIFYDLLEISSNLTIFEQFKDIEELNIFYMSPNYSDSIDCFEIFRESNKDSHIFYENIDTIDIELYNIKTELIFYEINMEKYFYSFIQALLLILKNQKHKGTCIIKIGYIFHKPIVDILYFLSSLYDKVYLSKPSTNNIISFDRYIICKNFQLDEKNNIFLKFNYFKLIVFLKKLENKNIIKVFDFEIPFYFKNKIDDLNIIIGQQQLEALNQIIFVYKNKNKDEKIETVKKMNIQKSISWCEKYKIPYNKFTEKINIFLPIITEIT